MTHLTPNAQPGRFHGMMENLGLAARATFVAVGGLALAVEGGAVVGYNIPGIVIEADAGTGIPGVSITPKCPPNSQPGVKVVVTEVGKSYTFTFADLTDGHTGSQNIPYGESGGFNAAIGHTVRTSYSGGPETDTQTVDCAANTTVAPTTVAPTTVAPPTTGTPPTTVAPPTTGSPTASIPGGEHGTPINVTSTTGSPTASIPGGEHGTPVAANTTTTARSGEDGHKSDTNDSTASSVLGNTNNGEGGTPNTGLAGDAKDGSGLARTGSDNETPVKVGLGVAGLGGLLIFLARRRRKADEQQAAA